MSVNLRGVWKDWRKEREGESDVILFQLKTCFNLFKKKKELERSEQTERKCKKQVLAVMLRY